MKRKKIIKRLRARQEAHDKMVAKMSDSQKLAYTRPGSLNHKRR